jgi:hypothetical protein
MKRWFRATMMGLVLSVGLHSPPSRLHAMGALQNVQQQSQGPKITTPTRAFLKRQCNTVKRGVKKLPGVKQLFPNCRPSGAGTK